MLIGLSVDGRAPTEWEGLKLPAWHGVPGSQEGADWSWGLKMGKSVMRTGITLKNAELLGGR